MFRFSDWELANDLKWEHDLEFEYKGTMYDIVERTKEGNITKLWCWPDKKETRLNKAINRISDNILGNDKENRQHQAQLNNFFKTLFNPSQSAWHSALPNPATIIFKPERNAIGKCLIKKRLSFQLLLNIALILGSEPNFIDIIPYLKD